MNTIDTINAAANINEALELTGRLGDAYTVRLDYIKAVKGGRAVGGKFIATRVNVNQKFRQVWSEQTGKPAVI